MTPHIWQEETRDEKSIVSKVHGKKVEMGMSIMPLKIQSFVPVRKCRKIWYKHVGYKHNLSISTYPQRLLVLITRFVCNRTILHIAARSKLTSIIGTYPWQRFYPAPSCIIDLAMAVRYRTLIVSGGGDSVATFEPDEAVACKPQKKDSY